jgi:hypothetical protein
VDISAEPGVTGGGDQVADAAVDEILLLADDKHDGGEEGDGRVYRCARSHDGSMPRWRAA